MKLILVKTKWIAKAFLDHRLGSVNVFFIICFQKRGYTQSLSSRWVLWAAEVHLTPWSAWRRWNVQSRMCLVGCAFSIFFKGWWYMLEITQEVWNHVDVQSLLQIFFKQSPYTADAPMRTLNIESGAGEHSWPLREIGMFGKWTSQRSLLFSFAHGQALSFTRSAVFCVAFWSSILQGRRSRRTYGWGPCMDALPPLPLPELWRLRTPSCLVRGVAFLKDEENGVKTVAELRGPGIGTVDGLAEILFPAGLPTKALSYSTVMTDSFTHRTYVGVHISTGESTGEGPWQAIWQATCAWSELPEVASPSFLKVMEAIEGHPRSAQVWAWLVNDVPAPPPGTSLILHGISSSGLCAASRVSPAGLPAVYVPLQHLLTRLSVSSVLLLTRLLLLEQKVLFVGSSVALLTSACEAFSSILLFPLAWVHCYNPLLPSTDYLATPPPFLFGCLREIILKETFADSNDLASSEILSGPRDFTIFDLDTGDVYPGEDGTPDLPDAAQSRLRFSFTELRSQLEAQHDLWPGTAGLAGPDQDFEDSVQKIFLTFMADVLGDVAGSLGPQCETATAASVLSSFQEGQFLSSVSAKDKPFFESFVQSNAFLAYLQTLHLFGTSESPFAEALRSLGYRKPRGSFVLPGPPSSREFSAPSTLRRQAAVVLNDGTQTPPLQLHLCLPAAQCKQEPTGGKIIASFEGAKSEDAESIFALEELAEEAIDRCHSGSWEKLCCDLYKVQSDEEFEAPEKRWSLLLLYAVLLRKMGASKAFLLEVYLALDHPAALPTHRVLELMNEVDPHRLADILGGQQGHLESNPLNGSTDHQGNPSARFARRLLAISNPSALASAEAARDPLAALAFVCPCEDEVQTDVDPAVFKVETRGSPRVELLPFKGPKETSVLNHRRFCNWTDRSPEVLSAALVRDVYRACVAVEKGSSKAHKLLERLSEPLAELQCCSLQGKNHEVRLSFWLNCLNAATLLAALAPSLIGIPQRPSQLSEWAELIRTAQVEVQGELLSLAEIEQIIRSQNHPSENPLLARTLESCESVELEEEVRNPVSARFQLKRPVPLASFGIHRPTKRGFPPLRIFEAKNLQAQLEVNAVQFLAKEMQLDVWRKKAQQEMLWGKNKIFVFFLFLFISSSIHVFPYIWDLNLSTDVKRWCGWVFRSDWRWFYRRSSGGTWRTWVAKRICWRRSLAC